MSAFKTHSCSRFVTGELLYLNRMSNHPYCNLNSYLISLLSLTEMPYPGLIREVWKELPGKSISTLKDDPYYPNDPSLIEIIENFDAPFDIDKDYGSRVKGYFVAPETGNYTFYMSGSQSGELWMSSTESQQNLSKLVSMDQPTGHNQWNKYASLPY